MSGKRQNSLPSVMAAGMGAFLSAVPAQAEPVTASCLPLASAEVCACATRALAEVLTAGDMALYAMASGAAEQERATGAGLVDAWDIATRKAASAAGLGESAARNKLTAAGAAHRDAIDGCGG